MNDEAKTNEGEAALSGIRVLDLSDNIAGQFCCRMLADYGAEVLLIEPPSGSATRHQGPFYEEEGRRGESLLFQHLNAGKRSVVLNTSRPDGFAQLLELVKKSDVVVVAKGLNRAAISAANPDCIIHLISDFGEDTPKSHWRGSEIVYQAMSGMMTNNGRGDRGPLYGIGDRASYCAGIASYVTVVAALVARERTGVSQQTATDIVHAAAAMTYPFTLQYSYNGSFELRGKRNTPLMEVKCKDGWISIWIRANHFPIICDVLECAELLTDPRFLDDNLRQDNLTELTAEIQKRVADRHGTEVVNALAARRIVTACSYRPSQLGPDAPHLKVRGFWETVATAQGDQRALGPQFRMSATPRGPLRAAPVFDKGSKETSNG